MSREPLKKGTALRFPDGQKCEIVQLLGAGGSALLYEVKVLGSELYAVVKEIFPAQGYVRKNGQILPANRLPRRAETLRRRKQSLSEQEALFGQKAGRKNYQVLFLQPPVWHRADLYLPDGTVCLNVDNTYARMDSLAEKGVPLAELVRNRRSGGGASLDETLQTMETILDAYAALHEDGFLHGDCQISNLFLLKAGRGGEGPGTACIIDFGSARELGEDGLTGPITDEVFSTDGYCAPELMFPRTGVLRLSAAADVWSLGFLLLTLLTDRGLDELDGITEFLMIHPEEKSLTYEETAALGCSPAQEYMLNRILKRALANEPDKRYPNAGEMRKDLLKLLRCRRLDTSKGVDRHLLWEASWRYSRANPALFQMEHVPYLAQDLPVRRLTVSARWENGYTAPVNQLLAALAQKGENVYLYGAGGAGKSFAAAPLTAYWMEHGKKRVPLYLDLAAYTAEQLKQCGGDCDQVIPALLAMQYFGCGSLGEQMDALLKDASCFLVLDNLHKVDGAVFSSAVTALNGLQQRYPHVWVLVLGRAEDPGAQQERRKPQVALAMQRVQLLPFSMEEITRQVKAVRGEVLDFVERATLRQQETTLGLPMFLMRYLELDAAGSAETDHLPDSTMELLHSYFAQREYRANDRVVHELLNEQLPWIAYQYERSGQPLHTAEEITEWLRERYSWGLDADAFFHQAVDALAVLEADGRGGYRFTHDCYQEYFAALFAVNCIQQAVSRRNAEPLKAVSCLWGETLAEHCVDLCCLEHRNGRVVRLYNREEMLDMLYRFLLELRRRDRMDLSNFFMNLYLVEWFGAFPDRAGRWLVLASQGHAGWRLFRWFARVGKLQERGRSAPLFLRVKGVLDQTGQGQHQMARLFAGGKYVRKNFRKARKYLQAAKEMGYPPALNDWGEILEKRGAFESALRLYREAADKQHPRAMWHVGQAYLHGHGVDQNPAEAYKFFELGAEYGDAPSQYSLGEMLEAGVGCSHDAEKALFWYRKAADQGLELAVEAAEKCRVSIEK